jgi:tetratricopeptide (TPR) repeat protein
MTARYGVPNACTQCHDDKPPEWASTQMDEWWGDGARREKETTTADLMYRAGSGDVTVLPSLGRLAIDRTQGSLIRAAAADYVARMLAGQYSDGQRAQSQTSLAGRAAPANRRQEVPPGAITPELVNRLIAAAADPEPVVRATAVSALAASQQTARIVPPITARLIDPARVVRARAAEALLSLGITRLPGAAGDALNAAQTEYAASLDAFPDVAANHASRGWLEAERGHLDEAQRALDRAIQVDPKFARSYVVKGVLSARAGRYQEAIDFWKKARSIEPGYPRIDDLIAEAEKRKAGAR